MAEYGQVYKTWLASIDLAADRGYRELLSGERLISDTRVCPRCGCVVQLLLVQKHEDFHHVIDEAVREVDKGSAFWNIIG